jgi:serine/threonine protein kinase/Tol biopolymer transport system component
VALYCANPGFGEPMTVLPGQRLGQYEIVEQLGAGGMGVVYRAKDTRLGRLVALKIPLQDAPADDAARARLLREAQNASALNHPHIATIYEVGEDGDQIYIAMELVEGRPLNALVPPDGMALETVIRYGTQIADAVAHAHERGVVHRDLKTANVVITFQSQAKVLDFGVAKRLLAAELDEVTRSQDSLTDVGGVVGTLQYMAPEVLRGEPTDVRSDLWAFGVMLYAMAAGMLPFVGRTAFELSSAILRAPPAPLPQSVPPGLRAIIQRCLAKEPGQRYQRASEVRAALEAIGQHAMLAPPAPVARPRRPWLSVGIGSAVLVLLLAGGVKWFRSKQSAAPSARYVRLTNFADSAHSPTLSPDGRMLAFIRGGDPFVGAGQIYVKLLPDGEPVQLTDDNLEKMSPVFTPDGSRVAYTGREGISAWDTWIVPVLGGTPQRMLPNASGLTWIDAQHVLFSEITKGIYMKVATSAESRADQRDVYLPPSPETGMAHRSYLSPSHEWVLVVEMGNGGWQPCRLVPFDGSSLGKQVGPSGAKCTHAAWSPDGIWMYFSADAGSGFHLWRQRFPDGAAEQLTSDVTEEEGVVVSPDGRSLITAVGAEQSTVWLHDRRGERQLSSEGFAFSPMLSPDGKEVYYVLRSGVSHAFWSGELWVADVAKGHGERLLPGFSIARYDISPDGKRIVFAASDAEGKSSLWLASLGGRFPPKRLTFSSEAYRPFFGPNGSIVFFGREGLSNYIYRMKEDGTGQEKLISDPVIYLLAVSPDGQWVVAWVARKAVESSQAVAAYPSSGGPAKVICEGCSFTGSYYQAASIISWAPNQKFLYLRTAFPGMGSARTFATPLRPGEALPKLSSSGIKSERDLLALSGSRMIEQKDVFPGSDPSTYVFIRTTTQRNLYRLRLER